MRNFRINAVMAGILYFLGTVFGVASTVAGGEVISSIVKTKPLSGADILKLVSAGSDRLVGGSFFILLMGISLVAMTVFLYPVFRKDSRELAMGMLLFRGALEGSWYFVTTVSMMAFVAIAGVYNAGTAESSALEAMCSSLYRFHDMIGPVGTIFFLIGASCLYVSFYRTRLIPRWLSLWGMIGVLPYLVYAILHMFGRDNGIGFYLQMVLAPQEIVMALWLIIKGFNPAAVDRLMTKEN